MSSGSPPAPVPIAPELYQQFNNAAPNGRLFWQWSQRGFGSELLTMLLGMVHAAEQGRQFRLCSRFSNITWRQGWQDYFLPFCPESANLLLARSHVRKPHSWPARLTDALLRWSGLFLPGTVLTHQVFGQVWNRSFLDRTLAIPGLVNTPEPVLEISGQLLRMLWRPTPTTAQLIQTRLRDLPLGQQPYAALHVRRGDKAKEAEEQPLAAYLAALRQHCPAWRRVFVATDDYAVVEQCRALDPEREFHSLCPPNRRGHLQRQFNRQTAGQRREQTLDLLADLTALRQAAYFIGTYSSSLGRLVVLFNGPTRCHNLEGHSQLIQL